jgi:hypothetical protein
MLFGSVKTVAHNSCPNHLFDRRLLDDRGVLRKDRAGGPKFKGRLLFLSGDEAAGKDLMELTAGPNDTFNNTTLTSGVFEAAASPDQSQLLYSTKGEFSCAIWVLVESSHHQGPGLLPCLGTGW